MHGRKNDDTRDDAHGVTCPTQPLPAFLTSQSDGVTLAIKLQPRASKNEICDTQGAELCIKVTAPPVDAAANEALLRLLADTLDCQRGHVKLIRGQTSRHKAVRICGLEATEVLNKLNDARAGWFDEAVVSKRRVLEHAESGVCTNLFCRMAPQPARFKIFFNFSSRAPLIRCRLRNCILSMTYRTACLI